MTVFFKLSDRLYHAILELFVNALKTEDYVTLH